MQEYNSSEKKFYLSLNKRRRDYADRVISLSSLESLCTRRFVIVSVVLCGNVFEHFFAGEAVQAERRGILNTVCSCFFSYRVIILRNTGRAIAIITTPKAMSIMSSVLIWGMPAPSTMTFRKAFEAYVRGRNCDMDCMNHGIC